jgi:ribonuclease Z
VEPASLAQRAIAAGRVLVAGAVGRGKSTLAARVADEIVAAGHRCEGVIADPGQPAAGPPGAVSRAVRRAGAWEVVAVEAIATLDVGRHRTALARATRRVAEGARGVVLADAPGLVRGSVGEELLTGLADALAAAEVWLVVAEEDDVDALSGCLAAAGYVVRRICASPMARRVPDRARLDHRTALWDAWLGSAVRLPGDAPIVGRAVPRRQAALVDESGRTVAFGEIACDGIRGRWIREGAVAARILVRDAVRDEAGLVTVPDGGGSDASPDVDRRPKGPLRIEIPRLSTSAGTLRVEAPNELFDDPLLHVRLVHTTRSLLLDLGEPVGLPTKLAHQVSDVFVTHAHMDHFSGFLWLIRRRVGATGTCRLYGPPDLAARVDAFAQAWTWDRIGDTGPRFEVHELHGDRIRAFAVQAGLPGARPLGERDAAGGILLSEPGFRVRAATLDHHGTPVLAFALEETKRFNVRDEALHARGWAPGPWLARLKEAALADSDAPILLPDGTSAGAADLRAELLLERPGLRLAYATDLAGSDANREALVALARGADVLVCESSFRIADAARAEATGHLTTTDCARIASEAEVGWLVPFHFSARYEDDPAAVYAEVAAQFPRTYLPRAMRR